MILFKHSRLPVIVTAKSSTVYFLYFYLKPFELIATAW